ncbi:MAG: M48 family metalloprotease [Gammaproteobacteria bacterium]|nr:M48 family metalloprotease [Gammaproteobacteria bacterium]
MKRVRNPLNSHLYLAVVTAAALVASGALASPGSKMVKELEENGGLYDDERWQRYVTEIGERLLAHSPDRGKKYHFYVLDGAILNAMAMPESHIFVSRGLIAYVRSEDELASVIGHEIAHITANHVGKRRLTDLLGKSVGFLSAIATGRGELNQLSNRLTSVVTSGYGREMELEADHLGAKYMAKAGYNPSAVLDMLHVLMDQSLFNSQVAGRSTGYHGLFASHPKQDKRLHDAVAYSQQFLPDELVEPVGDFWSLMNGLVYGDEAARGLVRDSTYYHSVLRVVIEFPDKWQVGYSSARVNGVAPGGAGVATISVMRHQPVKRKSPAKYVADVLKRDDVTSGTEVEINGNEAYIGEVDTSASNVQLGLIGVLYHRNDVFFFKGECGPNGDPEAFRQEFRATMSALRPMTQDDLKIANRQRIEVIVAKPGQTYAELAHNSPISQFPEETLRLLNGDHPNGEPRAGDNIKVVR